MADREAGLFDWQVFCDLSLVLSLFLVYVDTFLLLIMILGRQQLHYFFYIIYIFFFVFNHYIILYF
jgi:hypothetical protein